jgi:hypothetical protein
LSGIPFDLILPVLRKISKEWSSGQIAKNEPPRSKRESMVRRVPFVCGAPSDSVCFATLFRRIYNAVSMRFSISHFKKIRPKNLKKPIDKNFEIVYFYIDIKISILEVMRWQILKARSLSPCLTEWRNMRGACAA